MEKETTYKNIAETKYAFTSKELLEGLLAMYAIDLGFNYEFCIRNDRVGFHAELTVEHFVAVDVQDLT